MEGIRRMFGRVATQLGVLVALICTLGGPASLSAQAPTSVSITVQDGAGTPIGTGFRWLLQEDRMFNAKQGIPCDPTGADASRPCVPGTTISADTLSTNFHKSYMPPVDKGNVAAGGTATLTIPDPTKKYFVSVLPHCASAPENCYSISGGSIAPGQTAITVVVPNQPIPTAQIFVMAFKDSAPINNALDQGEIGLGGFNVTIADFSGGQVLTDTFGNPLGTFYDANGAVIQLGSGIITTITQAEINAGLNPYNLKVGEALIKNLAPGKYGVMITPAAGLTWQQTATIEGTKTIDAWVHAKEPRYMFELGPAGHHADFGFLQPFADATVLNGGGSISGRIVNMHMSRPPDYTMHKGHPLPGCWVGLNEFQLGRAGRGLYAAACNADSTFTIPNVPAGTYQLAVWDEFLDNIFALVPVTVAGGNQNLGDVGVFRWFGTHEHNVFFDANENGIRDPGEVGMRDQNINLRYRDGSIYQSFPTDTTGYVPFDEIFPFFNWLVAEVDYARFKPTGVTVTIDAGGPVAPGEKLTPQIQADGVAITRTETGPVLLEGFQSFLGTLNTFDWGKANYLPDENGGITGIVHYTTTRAEDDPRFAGAETWEPGIPRVPVFLYRKNVLLTTPDPLNPSKILDVNSVAGIQLADVDHAPFGWSSGGPMGPEDVKRNSIGGVAGTFDPTFIFNAGDAVQITTTDSWEDNLPSGCLPGNAPNATADPFYQGGKCYDGLRNFNQVRPAVFDGGLAFFTYVPTGRSSGGAPVALVPGYYIVEAVTPKGYEHQKEEDKNVVFGDASVVSPLLLAPVCVGDPHVVPAELALFPGVPTVNPGAITPLCDRKEVLLTSGSNAAADFFMFTEVPVAAQVTGFVLNDLANEFNPLSPNFSEKSAPSWIPISFRDWTGQEVVRVYTDQFGAYNAMLPSTYTISAPTPSGVSPQMIQACLNNPGPIKDPVTGQMVIDPFYNKHYGQVCWTLHYMPGTTTYADTPIVQIAAFVGKGNVQTDCECPDRTPRIFSVNAANNGVGGGPYVVPTQPAANRVLTITSLGTVQVPDPNAVRIEGNLGAIIARDYGFGSTPGQVSIGGIPLQNVTWSNSTITGTVPSTAVTGQLVVTRSDSGLSTLNSITVTVGTASIPAIRAVAAGQSIQAQLDAANPGDLILVQPGTYYEMLIMTKPVKLQGWGAGSTHIIASQSLTTQLQAWREKVNQLVNCPLTQAGRITLLPGQLNNAPLPGGPCGFEVASGLFRVDEGAGILVASQDGVFTSGQRGRIDGFSVAGSATSPGIVVNGYARFLEISNNQVANNQGTYGGGIRLGDPTITVSAQNNNASIHHNHIIQNGSQFAPGAGVALYAGSDSYQLTDNYVCGNFATEDGGGVAHYGFSPNGLIARNEIVFNQTFVQSVGGLGGSGAGGGLLVAGLSPVVGNPVQVSEGAGSVTIVSNLIQGNNAGSGDGAGVMLRNINGQDVVVSPTNNSTWYHVQLFNNIIVNNVAGLAGGGIALQDAAKVTMTNNTVAHNDSTATAGLAFTAGVPNRSNPQPAGIVSNRHSAGLCQAMQQPAICARYSDPVMQNNIILNNRSMFWQVNTQLPQPVGQLIIDGVRDLAVLPVGLGVLHPLNGILSNVTTGYGPTNLLVANSASVLNNPYFNAPPGFGSVQPDGTIIQLEFTTTLATAAALDEGGNFIDVHYGPLSPAGNYHLAVNSPAIDAGNNAAVGVSALLATDYDGQPRPRDGNGDGISRADIGADEVQPAQPAVTGFVLRNAVTDLVIVSSLTNGANINLATLCGNCQVNIEALVSLPGSVNNVRMALTGATTRSNNEGLAPYTLPGDNGAGNYNGMTLNLGTHTITATPFTSNGTAGFPLTVTFSVGTGGIPPTANNDAYSTLGGTALTVGAPGVLSNDVNPTATPLTAVLVTGPASGTLTLNATGSFTYTPAAGFVGQTSFTYRASNGTLSNIATATITVLNRPPVAGNDAVTTPVNTPAVIAAATLLANDSDPDGSPLTVTSVGGAVNGTVALAGTTVTFTPTANFTGTASFTYTISDGQSGTATATVTVTVTSATAPTANTDAYATPAGTALTVAAPGVLANDVNPTATPLTAALVTGPASGTLTLNANGSFTYTPAAGFTGQTSFTYQASNGTLSNVATVTLTVTTATGPAVTGFILRNATTDTLIGPLTSGTVVSLAACGNCQFNIEAVVSLPGSVQSVRLVLSGATSLSKVESAAPYTLPTDAGVGNYNGMTLNQGAHSITATPYSQTGANGTPGTPLTVSFTVAP